MFALYMHAWHSQISCVFSNKELNSTDSDPLQIGCIQSVFLKLCHLNYNEKQRLQQQQQQKQQIRIISQLYPFEANLYHHRKQISIFI